MARYTDAVCRLCRREGIKLFLKGTKCFSDKCPIEKRNFAPGQHGKDKKTKVVGYGLQLREKQKAKRIYFTQEGQFRNYFENAVRSKGVTGAKLLESLERRLDNVVFRLGFGISRRQARQLVRHGHVQVNGKKVNIPSYEVAVGEEIQIRESEPQGSDSRDRKGFCQSSAGSGVVGDRSRELQRPRHCAAATRRYPVAGE